MNGEKYALKILDKKQIGKYGKIESVMREKDIMFGFDHPNITRLEMTFQDPTSLFFLLEFAPNGDLSGLIKREKRLQTNLIRFYACEIINALECMRSYSVVHRDLKPENILLDGRGHIKLTDFGDSKVIDYKEIHARILSDEFTPGKTMLEPLKESIAMDFDALVENDGEFVRDRREDSFVGTPLYVSPEMLNHNMA